MELILTRQFYDDLSADYHLNYFDWDTAISNQSKILDKIIKMYVKHIPKTLLDCSCGIGTQAIGLAKLNYQVTASDLSPLSIKRARKEASKRKVNISFAIADFLQLDIQVQDTFDVVISCDNSLPHLLTDDELQLAAKNILSKMRPQGLFIASIRDYDELLKKKPISTYPVTTNVDDIKTFSFQTWNWMEDNIYNVNHFNIKGTHDDFTAKVRKVRYRAYKREEVTAAFKKQGFINIKWLLPIDSDYYQPLIIAFKP